MTFIAFFSPICSPPILPFFRQFKSLKDSKMTSSASCHKKKESLWFYISQQLYFMETSSPWFILIYPSVWRLGRNPENINEGQVLQKQGRRPQKNSEGNWKIWKIAKQRRMTKETNNTTRVTTFRVPLMLSGAAKVKKEGIKIPIIK